MEFMTIMDWIALGFAFGLLSYPIIMLLIKIIENAIDSKYK